MQTFFRILSLTLLLPVGACTLFGQTFVSTANEWYATDCCYIFVNGQTDCDTYNYWFSEHISCD